MTPKNWTLFMDVFLSNLRDATQVRRQIIWDKKVPLAATKGILGTRGFGTLFLDITPIIL